MGRPGRLVQLPGWSAAAALGRAMENNYSRARDFKSLSFLRAFFLFPNTLLHAGNAG